MHTSNKYVYLKNIDNLFKWLTYHFDSILAESTTIYLKVARVQPIPDSLEDHDVPIFTTNEDSVVQSEWDLTTQQVPFCIYILNFTKIVSSSFVILVLLSFHFSIT